MKQRSLAFVALPSGALAFGLALFVGLLTTPRPAQAIVTLSADPALSPSLFVYTRRVTMRIGSHLLGTISKVTFDVTGANVSPTPTPVVGVPTAGASVGGAPANSVRISVSNRWTDFAGQRVIVTVDSSGGLVCTAGPCGATTIPMSKISWTSSNLATGTYAGQDFASGSFTGSATQTLLDFTGPVSRSFNVTNDWVFTYANDTLYPAGVYQKRVTFTATMP